MTQYGTWVSYGGDARIWLAIGLLAVAGGVTLAGIRLPLPVRATRPGPVGRIAMILAWVASIAAFGVCATIYVRQYVHAYDLSAATTAPKDPIAPVTLTAVVVVFVIIISRSSPGFRTRLASAAIGAIAAPMIFELPFDLIVMARTYPPIPPDPALYRALFFVPLFLIEITTLLLLRLSPMVRLRRATFFSFALMLGVFAVWALSGFGYPSAPLPTALNIASKILAFVTVLTLFLPQRPTPEQAPRPDSNERAQPASPSLALDSPALTEIADDPRLTGQPAGSIVDEQAKPVPLSPGHHPRLAVVPQLARVKEADMSEQAVVVRGLCKSFGAKEAVAGIDLEIAAGSLAGLVGPNGAGKTTSLSMMTGLLRPDVGQILIHNPSVLFLDEPLEGVDPVSADVIRRLLTRFTASGSTVLFSSHVMELVEQVCDHVSIIDHGRMVATGTTEQVRGGKTLQQAFIDLVGPRARDEEGPSWLGASSS